MSKLKTIGIVLPIALILIIGGGWGYLWYSTKQQVDQIVTLAKPFADINYGDISISPTGSIAINRIRIILHAINDYLTIGSLQLSAPNFLALLEARSKLTQGRLPDALSLALRQIEIPLDGGLLGASQKPLSQRSPFKDLDALGCGAAVSLGDTEWREMGYTHFNGNMLVGYRLNAARDLLELQVESNHQDWAGIHMEVGIASSTPISSATIAAPPALKLAKLQVVLRDEGINQRRNRYCAAKAGKTIDAYLADHIQRLEERLRTNGVSPGPRLTEAYRRFLAEGGQLTITASPSAPLDPTELQSYKPDDAVKLAGLTLAVNGQPVSDLSMQWDTAKIAQALKITSEPPLEIDDTETTQPSVTAPPPVVASTKTYHPIPPGKLAPHIGKIAKIKTASNAQYKGKLRAVTENGIAITIFKSGGNATLSLRNQDIVEAQVFY